MMASRPAVRRERDNFDYSAIGKLGRRTGVALDRRPLDANGMEEITGIFSSPRKSSPLKQVTMMPGVEDSSSSVTPTPVPSTRRSARATPIPPPRSSSPKKSGISGKARKSNGADIFSARKPDWSPEDPEDRENVPELTPTRSLQPRVITPGQGKSPLRDITTPGTKTHHNLFVSPQVDTYTPEQDPPARANLSEQEEEEAVEEEQEPLVLDAPSLPSIEQPDEVLAPQLEEDNFQVAGSPTEYADVQEQESEVEEEQPVETYRSPATFGKKRKADTFDQEEEEAPANAPKKPKKSALKSVQKPPPSATESLPKSSKVKGKQPLRDVDTNLKLSARQEEELQDIVEKVKARPGPPRSLYILRRETPADDTVTHTRSGRVSVKPLAYWRNERCVYGASPSSAHLADGARFPLNSIKEIVRTEELAETWPASKTSKRKKKGAKGKGKQQKKASVEDEFESSDSEAEEEDPDAEPWETERGTFRGNVSIWDQQEQAPTEQEEEVEIAHAPGAINTREVKGSTLQDGPTFKYAKLLSTKFFGTGLVDLPPGGVKRPKNSRKMHMSFFVVKGRVTVTVGALGSEATGRMNRFSIGKGGFWQVPRGNQYSIENELGKPARIFFSQGCEPVPTEDEE